MVNLLLQFKSYRKNSVDVICLISLDFLINVDSSPLQFEFYI
jgi:hypothetical protein